MVWLKSLINASYIVPQVVARLRARCPSVTDDGLVNYVIQPGETPDQNGQPRSFYSRINERNNEMVLLTYRPYDDLLVTPC